MALTDSGGGRKITAHNVGNVQPWLTLSGTVKLGDPIGYNSGWLRSAAESAVQARFIALRDGVSGDRIPVCTEAEIEGFTLGTPGGTVYNLDGTAGSYAEAASSTGGEANTQLGAIISATKIFVSLDPSGSNDSTV